MSKDLSKEYKEAIMNDLPDLWDRIEAAIDANETAGETKEDTTSNVIQFTKTENNTNSSNEDIKQTDNSKSNSEPNTANKYAVNAFDNEPVIKQSRKKKIKIPSWVFIALPSVAVLVLVIIPVAFMMSNSGLSGTANYTKMDAAVTVNTASDSVATEAAPASVDSGESFYYEDASTQANEETYEYNNTSDPGIYDFSDYDSALSGSSQKDTFPTLDIPQLAAPEDIDREKAENGIIVNDRVAIKILNVSESSEGEYKIVEALIVEFKGETLDTEAGELKEGDNIEAYASPDSDFSADETYDVSIIYLPYDELLYGIAICNEE